MDRDDELDAFKRVNLSLVASAFGYEIVPTKSTRHSVLMSSGVDKIIVSQNGEHYIYCSVHDPASAGTVIDFVQRVVEPGCSLGRVRQVLRPFLGGGHVASLRHQHEGRFQAEIAPSQTDFLGVAARMARFEPIDEPHKYLCEERGIPFELLQSDRLKGRVLRCPRRGSIVFPHWGSIEALSDTTAGVTGYEIKGRGVNLFSKGGQKQLWMSAGHEHDRILAVTESGIDALSYLAVRGEEGIRAVSLSGQMNLRQPDLVRQMIASMPEGSHVVAAFDNDRGGDRLCETLDSIVSDISPKRSIFREDRPPRRGDDWNSFVMRASEPALSLPSAPGFRR